MENTPVVNEELTIPQPSEGTTPETTPAPGSKTDSELLLKSLQEEREKRRALEEELLTIKQSDEIFSDEGKVLKKEISNLEEKFTALEEEKNLQALFFKYPLLKEKVEAFKEYRKSEHPRANLESVAKLYLVENDLLETTPRKGLENPTGGSRTPIPSGMSNEDIKHLRETNYRKYLEMLKKDQIKIS